MGKAQKKLTAQANALTAQGMRQSAQQARKANRVAVRTAQQERKASSRQNQQLIAAERASAAALAKVGEGQNIRTDVINDPEAERKRLLAMGGRSAYGFQRPGGSGLGGGMSPLG